MEKLGDKVNLYVEQQLDGYTRSYINSPKVIHDSILGTNIFYPHEMVVLDSPLLQRLRRISQVDVVPLVFPSGNHNRFEHSLGVTVIADKLVNALRNRQAISPEEFESLRYHVRMAGILHDCGHGAFSHMSEEIHGKFDDMLAERQSNKTLYGDSKPHEILSYLIVTSPAFKDFFSTQVELIYGISLDLDLIGQMIIGYISDPLKAFWVEIINGAFDADKLDYIQRDSHFTGIQMILDLDRLFHTLDLIEIDGKKRLTIDFSGVSTLEEIVFDKMMLVSTVYNHHKVRSAECLFKSIFDHIRSENILIYDMTFDSAADFLYITDEDIYSLAKKQDIGSASTLARNLLNRNLPKRSLVISGRTISNNRQNLQQIMSLDRDDLQALRDAIVEEVRKTNPDISNSDVWVDLPKIPKFKEGSLWPIKEGTDSNSYITLRQVFPVDDWTKAFSEHKWAGYVFTWPQFTDDVNLAAQNVIEEVFDIKFNQFARSICKIKSKQH
ncbi:MAG: HD domain-containing protein [Syntrophomonadaceae bacterium]|nr:HD domain-containing protein [Syntrophomonadaceae bacterium]